MNSNRATEEGLSGNYKSGPWTVDLEGRDAGAVSVSAGGGES